jgi:nucleoside-diphosphate-sugar epimerase
MMVANVAARVHAGEEVVVQGDPGLRLNPIHVDDAARAFAAALELPASGAFNVGGQEVISLTALAALLAELAGLPPRIRHTDGASASLVGDTTRMRERLGVLPAIALREGLAGVLSRLAGRAP